MTVKPVTINSPLILHCVYPDEEPEVPPNSVERILDRRHMNDRISEGPSGD